MGVYQTDIVVAQGEDWTNVFTFQTADASGDPAKAVNWDFTGAVSRMQVRQTLEGASTLVFDAGAGGCITLGGTAGTVKLDFTKAQTLTLASGTYDYDLLIDWGNGTTTELLRGRFIVNATPTR